MEPEDTEGKLQTKVTQLETHAKRTEQVLSLGSVEAIERHLGALRPTITEADNLKRSLEALKIAAKVDLTQIGTWNSEVDLQLMKAEEEVGRLRKWFEDRKRQEEITAHEDQIKFEMELHERKIKLQTDLMQENRGEASPKQT